MIIEKLRKYGLDEESLAWFKDYLSLRKQVTVINGNVSEPREVACGVPQGSILGPLLFIITINDIVKVVKNCTVSLYADDTCLYYSSSNPHELERCINEDLNSISKWLKYNGLLLNQKKCESMIITSMRRRNLFRNIQFVINGSHIQPTSSCKYLGVALNNTLTWNNHIDSVKGKLSSSIYCFKRIRPFISQETALTLYKGLIQPHLDYCSVIWMNAGKTLLQQIDVLQRRALRAILLVDNRFSSQALYEITGVEPIEIRWKKQAAIFIFKLLHKLLPEFICDRISVKENPHQLRNSNNIIHLNKPRTNYMRLGCIYSCAQIFNNLPESVRMNSSKASFKRALDTFVCS